MPHLPPELLHEVFDRIKSNKSHLSPCLLVCKSWYFTAQLFFSKEMKIITNDSNLQCLKADLIQYPTIASKISSITLDETSSGNQPPELYVETLSLAPNLIDLNFALTNVYTYLVALYECPCATLPSIQKIFIVNLKYAKPSSRQLHFMVNFRFRKTIKNLEIMGSADGSASQPYAELSKVIKDFPSLTHLKKDAELTTGGSREFNVDVLTLIDASPMLEVIKLYNYQNVSIPNATEQLNYTRVKKLKIKTTQMDIQTLHIISTQFPNLNSLRVVATKLTSDPALSLSEAKNILKLFEEYGRTLARVNINIVYLQEPPILVDLGKRNPKLRLLNAHVFGNIPENFMHELLMMHDEWLAHEDDIDLYDDEWMVYADDNELYDDEWMAYANDNELYDDEWIAYADDVDLYDDEWLAHHDDVDIDDDGLDRVHDFIEFDENVTRLDELMNEEELMFRDGNFPDENDVSEK